jgi:hypothetical protein
MFKYLKHTSNYGALYTVAASEENAVYPATNLQLQRLSKTWRSNGDLTAVDITADLGIARSVDIIGLSNHNFTAGVSLDVAAGTTTSYADYSTTITYRAGSAYAVLPSPQTYQYWRIRISDGANSDPFLEAGYLLLGLLGSTPRGIEFASGITIDHIADVNSVSSETGAIFSDWINDRKRLTVNFNALSLTERQTMLSFVNDLKEQTNPLFIIPQHTIYDGWYMRLTTTPNERANQVYGSVGPLTFLEDGGGKIMAA